MAKEKNTIYNNEDKKFLQHVTQLVSIAFKSLIAGQGKDGEKFEFTSLSDTYIESISDCATIILLTRSCCNICPRQAFEWNTLFVQSMLQSNLFGLTLTTTIVSTAPKYRDNGHYLFPLLFSMHGEWSLDIQIDSVLVRDSSGIIGYMFLMRLANSFGERPGTAKP